MTIHFKLKKIKMSKEKFIFLFLVAEGRGCKEFPPCTTIPQPPTLGHEGTPIVVVVTGRSTLLILVLGVLAGVALATMFFTLCARKEVRVLLEDQKLISTLIGRVFSKS